MISRVPAREEAAQRKTKVMTRHVKYERMTIVVNCMRGGLRGGSMKNVPWSWKDTYILASARMYTLRELCPSTRAGLGTIHDNRREPRSVETQAEIQAEGRAEMREYRPSPRQ